MASTSMSRRLLSPSPFVSRSFLFPVERRGCHDNHDIKENIAYGGGERTGRNKLKGIFTVKEIHGVLSNDAWEFLDGERTLFPDAFLSSVQRECGSNIVSYGTILPSTVVDINVSMERRKFNIQLIHIEQHDSGGRGLVAVRYRDRGEGTHFHLSPLKMSRASL